MIICFLCGVIAVLVVLQHIERRDLYNRIMSKSYKEYKNEEHGYTPSKHKEVLNRWRGEAVNKK